MRRLVIVLAIHLAWCATPVQAEPQQVPVPGRMDRNLVYAMYSGLALLMDVRYPAKPNGRAVLHIPGSGWQAAFGPDTRALKDDGHRGQAEQPLLDAGFTVFTINHRAAPRFRFPAAFEDAQRAMRYIRRNAGTFGVRGDWMGVIGVSSGGHLAALLATRGEGSGDAAAAHVRRPDCVVTVMAPMDLTAPDFGPVAVGFITSFIGHPPAWPDDGPAEQESFGPDYNAASPIRHVSASVPPMLVIHGDADDLVPVSQARSFVDALRAVGGKADLEIMQGIGHRLPGASALNAGKWMKACAGH